MKISKTAERMKLINVQPIVLEDKDFDRFTEACKTLKWEREAEETRKSLDEGNGITFPNAQEAIHWLQTKDTTETLTNKASHLL